MLGSHRSDGPVSSKINRLRHSAGPLAFGLQAQSRGCVKLVGVKFWFDDDHQDDTDDEAEEDDDDDHRDED